MATQAYVCKVCLLILTKDKVSTKLIQDHPYSHPHGGPKSTTLNADHFIQLLVFLISCSFSEEKLYQDGHPDTMQSLKRSSKLKKHQKYTLPEYITEYTGKCYSYMEHNQDIS